MGIKFCSADIRDKVIALLYEKLFHPKNNIFTCDDLLGKRYKQMECNFEKDKTEWKDIDENNKIAKYSDGVITDDVLLASKINNCPDYPFNFLSSFNNWGHDLPIWIEKDDTGENKKMRIMIIAQDPLRTNCENGYIYFSSPFGLHSKAYRGKDPSNVWKIINSILIKYDVQIYLTDYYKFYTTGGLKQLIGIIRNGKDKLNQWASILNDEIGIWKPQLIFTFGKEAAKNLPLKDSEDNKVGKGVRAYFEEYYYYYNGNDKLKVVLFPHPSGNNKKTIRKSFNVNKDIRLTNENIKNNFIDKFNEYLGKKSCDK